MSNSYKIKKGDTLSRIAKNNGTTVAELAKLNGIADPNKIFEGHTLKLPNSEKPAVGVKTTLIQQKAPNSYSDIDLTKYDSGYQKSDDVINAETKKTDAENALSNFRDEGFNYSQDAAFKDIMDKILNREKFSYDLNGDALYQQYKDKYIQQGKMAMQDTMGQAAALTGGYGSSYASTAGNQAYQASLQNLNDVIPELYQLAYDRYNQEGQDMLNKYSMLSDDRSAEYAMWGDKYNRLASDRDYYGNEANNAYTKDYGEWSDRRDFDTNQYWAETEFGYGQERDAIADKQWQAQFDEAKRQYDEQMAFSKEQYEYQKAQAEAAASRNSGGNTSYANGGDDSGAFHQAVYRRSTEGGNIIWEINGKEIEVEAGVNPYTGTKNTDILGTDKKGNTIIDPSKVFRNGYQPNNINGQKLSKSGITDVVNGVTQNVWKTPDGKLWIWDGTKNKYLQYEE